MPQDWILDLDRRAEQLLQALQIVNGDNAVREGMRRAQTKANLQYIYEIFNGALSAPLFNTFLSAFFKGIM